MEALTIQRFGWAGYVVTTEGGTRIVVDPYLHGSEGAHAGLPQSPFTVGDLADADVVAVTHAGYDHRAQAFDIALAGRAILACGTALHGAALDSGVPDERCAGMVPGVTFRHGDATLKALDAGRHTSNMVWRGQFVSDEPMSFLLTTRAGSRIFCGGDFSISWDMKAWRELYAHASRHPGHRRRPERPRQHHLAAAARGRHRRRLARRLPRHPGALPAGRPGPRRADLRHRGPRMRHRGHHPGVRPDLDPAGRALTPWAQRVRSIRWQSLDGSATWLNGLAAAIAKELRMTGTAAGQGLKPGQPRGGGCSSDGALHPSCGTGLMMPAGRWLWQARSLATLAGETPTATCLSGTSCPAGSP